MVGLHLSQNDEEKVTESFEESIAGISVALQARLEEALESGLTHLPRPRGKPPSARLQSPSVSGAQQPPQQVRHDEDIPSGSQAEQLQKLKDIGIVIREM